MGVKVGLLTADIERVDFFPSRQALFVWRVCMGREFGARPFRQKNPVVFAVAINPCLVLVFSVVEIYGNGPKTYVDIFSENIFYSCSSRMILDHFYTGRPRVKGGGLRWLRLGLHRVRVGFYGVISLYPESLLVNTGTTHTLYTHFFIINSSILYPLCLFPLLA